MTDRQTINKVFFLLTHDFLVSKAVNSCENYGEHKNTFCLGLVLFGSAMQDVNVSNSDMVTPWMEATHDWLRRSDVINGHDVSSL